MPKALFSEFIERHMASVLEIIRRKTSKICLPIEISESIVMPNEVMVTLRNSEKVRHFSLTGWFSTNIETLCKSLIVRQIDFTKNARDLDATANGINQHMTQLNREQGLNLIGGFLLDGKKVLQCLFFKAR